MADPVPVHQKITLAAGDTFDWNEDALWLYGGSPIASVTDKGWVSFFQYTAGGTICNVAKLDPGYVLIGDGTNGALTFDLTTALAGKAATSQKLDDFGTPDDNTDLDASTTAHGLMPKAVAPAAGLLNVFGIANGETAPSNKALFDTTNPAALGSVGPGTSTVAARRDHVHAMPSSADVGAVAKTAFPFIIQLAASDTSTAITAGTAKVTFRMPFAATLTAVRASCSTAPTGSTIIIDINEGGTSVLSTKLSIDASEFTSTTAASAAVISDAALADDSEITIDFDQVGSTIAGKGVVVTLVGTRDVS